MQAAYRALVRGDVAGALNAYRYGLHKVADNPPSLHRFARLVCDLQTRESDDILERVLRLLVPHDQYSFFAMYQLVQRAWQSGVPLERALDRCCTGPASRHKDLIGRLIASGDGEDVVAGRRHIAICGVSRSGSTLLDRLLNGLPGVASIGESHWLIQSFDGARIRPLNPAVEEPRVLPQCDGCGSECRLLTLDFRCALDGNPRDWYFRIARQLDAAVLVSSDKNLPKIVLNDPRLRLDALVLYRSPKRAWASELARLPSEMPDEFYLERMREYNGTWRTAYAEMLSDFTPRGEKLFVNFDYFALAPDVHLRAICECLGLAFDPAVLRRAHPGHAVGGNANAVRRLREVDYVVSIDRPGKPAIPAAHAAWIDGQAESTDLFAEMNERAVQALWPGR